MKKFLLVAALLSVSSLAKSQALAASSSQTDVTCFGACNGSATVIASGGTSPYSYNWSPSGGTAATASALCAGNYTCTVTDAVFASVNVTVNITQPTPITISPSQQNVSCNGGNDGHALATVSGGAGFFTYSWSPVGGNAPIANSLTAGIYTVTVTDANSCTASQTFQITEPPALSATNAIVNVSCFGGSDGSAVVTVNGGTPGYMYSWAPGGYTTDFANGLSENLYLVSITDLNGCFLRDTVNISAPSQLTSSITGTDVTCFNSNDGTAMITVNGGTGPFNYSWAPNGGSGNTQTGLSAATYTCNVTDAHGCTTTQTIDITEPAPLSSIDSQTDVSCFGGSNGSASVSVSGGNGSYSYNWSPSGGNSSMAGALMAGSYSCTITDINGCMLTETFSLTEPSLITVVGSQFDASCSGGNNGSATVNASGGTGPLTYSWTSGGTAATETSLSAGSYTCTVTDMNGCVATQTFVITEPAAMTSNAMITGVTCYNFNNGSITLNMNGGAAPYNYYWSDFSNNAYDSMLVAGVYTLTVQDANSCVFNDTFTVSQPAPLSFVVTQTDISCHGNNDGTASVTPSGGTGPYTYLWNTGNTSSSLTDLSQGIYTCVVTDSNGCVDSAQASIYDPGQLVAFVQAVLNPTTCGASDGGINIAMTGGTQPFIYQWSNGDTIEDLYNIAAGVYSLTVTDAHGCVGTALATLSDPNAPVVAMTLPETFICIDDDTLLISGIPAGGTFTGNGMNGSVFDPSLAGLGQSVIAYAYTDTNGCLGATTDTITVDPCTGIQVNADYSQWNIFPNPTTGDVFITAYVPTEEPVHVQLFSSEGKLIRDVEWNTKDEMHFGIQDEASGIYLVRIISADSEKSFRIIRQ
ncbi:MAG: T9SS type A sorting domain-containing protein [Bacteroidetes bacterium]|nr:T9SS type A sorting domain-containing protein [Bacteroidota bacterium]